ncbi:SWIRM domain containing protein [Tritrichomonas foetus]|uniref:SWIRM domain containing protein n=1 Tax=Tritrichomonas foetus TaxID=1144522 RepID=A0A1J4KNS7_9EUKA|nr:SWIRM domain containing protein [Tritrichomonas foetus]|eukprot:OHT11452.1 SWIRM domain containing protein [Tritrichomonas foetus]
MTAVKHPFENFDSRKSRRFKTESLLDATNYKVTKFCQTAVNPPHHPRPPLPHDPRPYAIPAHSRWFSFQKIHAIERAEFPELSDPAEAKRYKRIRNKFIKLFRLYPTQEVTTATMRHIEGGDSTIISKIHKFLCLWGLINFTPGFCNNQPNQVDARLVHEYSKIIEDPPLNVNTNYKANQAKVQPTIDVCCTVCKVACGDGHFCSRKYPGVVICPQCFSHQSTLTQLEVPHAAFEFRSLPAPPNTNNRVPQRSNDEILIFDKYESMKEDWTQISEKTESKSPLDCLILFLRSSLNDVSQTKQLTSHEFNDENMVLDLLEFANEEKNEEVPHQQLNYQNNWEELDEELQKIEEEIRCFHTIPNC